MRVQKVHHDSGLGFLLFDGEGLEVTAVSDFLRHLRARGSSPNTLSAYAYDLLHFFRFLANAGISYLEFTPRRALDLLQYLRDVPCRGKPRQEGYGRDSTETGGFLRQQSIASSPPSPPSTSTSS
jgi:hypothetical protein